MVKNLLSSAGGMGSIPGWGTKIPHAVVLLSPCVTTTEFMCLNERAHVPQTIDPTCPGAHMPQLERENAHSTTRETPAHCKEETAHHNKRSPHASMKIQRATTKTQHSQKIKKEKRST